MAKVGKVIKRAWWILLLLIFLIVLAVVVFITMINVFSEEEDQLPNMGVELIEKAKKDSALINAATADHDTAVHIIRVSDPGDLNVPYDIDEEAGHIRRVFSGRRINIAVIGVDSRLGAGTKHADANHVVSFLIDEGKIEITSIPRDTPCDALQDDSTQNKLTVLYPALGRKAYFAEVSRIAELDKIHYFVEVGFSQARGILELLGFKNSGSALQVLRSRTGLGGDDYQRVYSQAQFIRQMFLKHFDKLTGFFSEILVRGGLSLVESNLKYDNVENILKSLKSKGFPKSPDDISIRIRPAVNIKYKIFDFSNQNVVSGLSDKIEGFNSRNSSTITNGNTGHVNPGSILRRKITNAISDSASKPLKVISDLKTLFNQRAWLQVEDKTERERIRDQFGILLFNAYMKKKQPEKAEEIKKIIESEKKLFSIPVFEGSDRK